MKKSNEMILIAALLVAAVAVPTLRAQDNPDRPEGAPARREQMREQMRERLQMMAQELGLTDAQKAQVRDIMQQSFEEGKALRDDTTLTPEQKREKGMAIRKGVEEKIDAILTPEQLAKKKEMRAAHGGGPDGKRPEGKKHKKPEASE